MCKHMSVSDAPRLDALIPDAAEATPSGKLITTVWS